VLTPPPELYLDRLVAVLVAEWDLAVASIEYRPVGFGSHHWEVATGGDRRWFITVDDLDEKTRSQTEGREAALERLRRALGTARALADADLDFVVAPERPRGGCLVPALDDRFAVAVYRHVDGTAFAWGDELPAADRAALVDRIASLHTHRPLADAAITPADGHAVPHREALDAILAGARIPADRGPYAEPAARLIAANRDRILASIDRHTEMAGELMRDPGPAVVTHGEPHPGNVIVTESGPVLVDWDTACLAPPERDLWLIDPGDGSVLDEYRALTGFSPRRHVLELYRTRWDLADLASFATGFSRPHTGTEDDAAAWRLLSALVGAIERPNG
jgi:aminoglycoside phosphotransferase (APT) family kinase protein